jgi:hypothetical protein
MDIPGGVYLVTSGKYILCFNHCLLLIHSLSPHSPNVQQHTVQCIIFYSDIDGLFQYFSFSNIFYTFPTSNSWDRLTNKILFSLTIPVYINIYGYIYLCIHLTYRSRFHIWGKTHDLWNLSLAYFLLDEVLQFHSFTCKNHDFILFGWI